MTPPLCGSAASGEATAAASSAGSSTSVTSPASASLRPNAQLVVVDRLAVALQPRDDDGALVVRERRQDGAHSRVADDDARAADVLDELLVREVLDVARAPRRHALGSALHDQLLVARELVDRAQQPLEREVQGADRDEDHEASNTLPR